MKRENAKKKKGEIIRERKTYKDRDREKQIEKRDRGGKKKDKINNDREKK